MNLFLTTYQTPYWDLFLKATQLPKIHAFTNGSTTGNVVLKDISGMETLDAALTQLPEGIHIWLLVEQAECYIAHNIESGTPLNNAAQNWQLITADLLQVYAKNRKRISLLNIHHALSSSDQFNNQFHEIKIDNSYKAQYSPNSLELLIANQLIIQNPALRLLNDRLIASCFPIQDTEALTLDLDDILNNHRAGSWQKQRGELESLINEMKEDLDITFYQLQKTQEALDEYHLKLQSLKSSPTKTRALHKAKARAAIAEYNYKQIQQDLNLLHNSISWKIGKPIRALGRFLRKSNCSHSSLSHDIRLLLSSEYFDADWYMITYPDVAQSNMNPAEHYLLYGASEGRLPSQIFDGNWYLQQYPDVASAKINPLVHFILYGQHEGRKHHPYVDFLNHDSQD